jgi:hypothetical protein
MEETSIELLRDIRSSLPDPQEDRMMMTKSLLALALSVAVFAGSVAAQGEKPPGPSRTEGIYVWGVGVVGNVRLIDQSIALGGRHGVIRSTRNPLLAVDDYKTALDKVSNIRARLDTVDDPKAASLLLDELSRAIDEARRALWLREQAKKKDK